LSFFAFFSHFYFGIEFRHCSLLWKPWLQLNEEVKTSDIIPFTYLCNHSASKCNSDFRFGTWKYLRNTTLCGVRQ
jgi:hypothetical protein